MNWQIRSWYAAEHGVAAAETVLVMTALLLLVAGSIDFARALWTNNTMLLAVEEAGRYAMVHNRGLPATCAAQKQAPHCGALSPTPAANCVASEVEQLLSAYQVPNVGVSVSEDTTSAPATMTICASYSFELLASRLLPFNFLDLNVHVTVPLI